MQGEHYFAFIVKHQKYLADSLACCQSEIFNPFLYISSQKTLERERKREPQIVTQKPDRITFFSCNRQNTNSTDSTNNHTSSPPNQYLQPPLQKKTIFLKCIGGSICRTSFDSEPRSPCIVTPIY